MNFYRFFWIYEVLFEFYTHFLSVCLNIGFILKYEEIGLKAKKCG